MKVAVQSVYNALVTDFPFRLLVKLKPIYRFYYLTTWIVKLKLKDYFKSGFEQVFAFYICFSCNICKILQQKTDHSLNWYTIFDTQKCVLYSLQERLTAVHTNVIMLLHNYFFHILFLNFNSFEAMFLFLFLIINFQHKVLIDKSQKKIIKHLIKSSIMEKPITYKYPPKTCAKQGKLACQVFSFEWIRILSILYSEAQLSILN